MHYFFNYVLIDKIKPTAGVGWMEFVMNRSQEDIKMELTLALIEAGLTDSEIINHAVNSMYLNIIARTFLTPQNSSEQQS